MHQIDPKLDVQVSNSGNPAEGRTWTITFIQPIGDVSLLGVDGNTLEVLYIFFLILPPLFFFKYLI